MVDCGGLENRCTLTGTVGSNPTASAKFTSRAIQYKPVSSGLHPGLPSNLTRPRREEAQQPLAREIIPGAHRYAVETLHEPHP